MLYFVIGATAFGGAIGCSLGNTNLGLGFGFGLGMIGLGITTYLDKGRMI